MWQVQKFLARSLSGLAAGLSCRTLLFVVCLPFFYSYDCARDEYDNFFQFGSQSVDFSTALVASYAIPLLFLIAAILKKPAFVEHWNFRALAGWTVFVGATAKIIFWFLCFVLAMSAHFTARDISPLGVC